MAITEHIENYPGFTEPVLGHEITDKFVKHAQKFGAVIRQGNCVDVIDDGIWKSVILEDGRKIKCKAFHSVLHVMAAFSEIKKLLLLAVVILPLKKVYILQNLLPK